MKRRITATNHREHRPFPDHSPSSSRTRRLATKCPPTTTSGPASTSPVCRRGNDHDPSWFAPLSRLTDADVEYDLVIVGAGISGCVFAQRASAELGLRSLIVDKRDHIGGNCYDFINARGFRVSQYGVHLFHTKHERVWEYVNRFGEWTPYEHRVRGAVERDAVSYTHLTLPTTVRV